MRGCSGPLKLTFLALFAFFLCQACVTPEWHRTYGIAAPEDLSNPSSLPKLIKALQDPKAQVRVDAAEAIQAFGSDGKEARPILMKMLEDENPRARVAAIETLLAINIIDRAEIAASLVSVILHDNPNARRLGILAHQRIGCVNDDTLEALRTVAEGDPHAKLRPLAAMVLREISVKQVKIKHKAIVAAGKKAELSELQTGMLPSRGCREQNDDLAIVVGVEKYQNLAQGSEYSNNDAKLIRGLLRSLCFQDRNIEFLVDEQATLSAIRKSFEAWLPNHSSGDRRVFVYFSGHGAPDLDGKGYLVPYDGDPNYLPFTAYPLQNLYKAINSIEAREKIVLIDSCFSGAGGRSILPGGARPVFIKVNEPSLLTGNSLLVTSSGMDQISTSFPEKQQGLFTYYFVEAIKKGFTDFQGIYSYLKTGVENGAKRMNIEQTPTVFPADQESLARFDLQSARQTKQKSQE